MTTPTPRTDAMVSGNSDPSADEYEDLAAFARQLERDLAAAQERNTQLVKALDDMYGTPCEQIRHQQELQAAQEARQRAEADAERYRWLRNHASNFDPPIYSTEAIDAAIAGEKP